MVRWIGFIPAGTERDLRLFKGRCGQRRFIARAVELATVDEACDGLLLVRGLQPDAPALSARDA